MVDAKPKSYRSSCMIVRFGTYQGLCPFRASKLIGDISELHGETRTISYLMALDSEKTPGDVILVPTNEASEDNLPVEWKNAGKEAVVDMIKLLAHKKITIPENSNMVIELYKETDSMYEHVIGMRFVGATFEAQKERPKKTGSKSGPPTGSGTPGAAGGTGQGTASSGPQGSSETKA